MNFFILMNPIHPHCGPFNKVNKRKSSDPVDEACRQHDIAYGEIGPSAYWNYNNADETFVQQMSGQSGLPARLYENVFRLKKEIFPSSQMFPPTPKKGKVGKFKPNLRIHTWGLPKYRGKNINKYTGPKRIFKRKARKYTRKRFVRRKFKKGGSRKRTNKVSFNTQGTVEKLERGGHVTTTDLTQTVYIGHGVCAKNAWRAAIRALVKQLFLKAGHNIANYDRPMSQDLKGFVTYNAQPDTIVIRIIWRYGTAASATTTKTTLLYSGGGLTSTNYNTFCSDIDNDLATDITAGTCAEQGLHLEHAALFIRDSTTGVETPLSNINLRQFNMEYKITSNLVLQNITKSALGGTDEEYLTSNIGSNPVHGKVYKQHKWLNGFNIKDSSYSTGSSSFFVQDVNPVFSNTSEGSSDVSILRKPPAGWAFGCKGHKAVMMPAGGFSKHFWKWDCKISFHGFGEKYFEVVALDAAGLQDKPVEFGTAQMVALESMLNNRSEAVGLDISYEVNQVLQCKGFEKKTSTMAIINLAT